MKKIVCGLGVTAVFVAFGIAGNGDYQAELDQQAHYCQMVADGHWPDYDQSINCENQNAER